MSYWVTMDLKLPVSQEILSSVARIDRFQGRWPAWLAAIAPSRLNRLEEAARIQAVSASCRLAGLRVLDHEVAALLRGESATLRDAAVILGYAKALGTTLPGKDRLLVPEDLQRLHSTMIAGGEPTPWREISLDREAFDAEGQATGFVFSTLPPRMVEEKTDQALTWLEFESRAGQNHPILVIGTFLAVLLAISPFERGNGRLMRVLMTLLLRRAGYDHVRLASFETHIEESRERFYSSYDQAHTRIWTAEADVEPWIRYFLEILDRQRERIETKLELERSLVDFPPLQRAILEAVREHGSADAGLLIAKTGANRNTLKDNLRRLVERGLLEKTGQRRGARYRLAGPEGKL